MINTGDKLKVKDAFGREWGNLTIEIIKDSMVHGHLIPTQEFDKVKPIFEKHEKLISEENDISKDEIHEKNHEEIVNLGVELLNEENKTIYKPLIVFVNNNLLLTFEIE